MDKEILARAKELEKDIRQMELALSFYKRGRRSHCGINDSVNSFHFEFCMNWSHRSVGMQDLPTWLNKPLMEVVERELRRCKHEFETLSSEQDGGLDKTVNGLHASAVFVDEQEPLKKKRPTVLSMFYALLMCLLYVALAVGVNILPHKLFGLYYGLDLITFSMAFSVIWVLCYLSIKED